LPLSHGAGRLGDAIAIVDFDYVDTSGESSAAKLQAVVRCPIAAAHSVRAAILEKERTR